MEKDGAVKWLSRRPPVIKRILDKKKPGINVPGKFIREASRLGDVGPLSGPWVSRAGRPAKTEKTVREKTLYRGAAFTAAVRETK